MTRQPIPPHLRQYVVTQDYDQYDEIDQAVWRFVLLQTYDRLCASAHPAYAQGLAQTGISVERIPRIAEMDDCLAEFGWGAVAVDGFLPPRAFQEFQALGIMTIAAEIRRPGNLAYTPAPDIIHESAGHSPIVPDPTYRSFLQRIGEVGAKAFSLPQDRRLYEAIYRLSERKEDVTSTAAQIAQAELDVADAQVAVTSLSEAALVSRLHWWTVEYGLVGTCQDYRLYGAGLLSSLGESHFCHDPSITKIRLNPKCIDVGYDITRPQPQLFVAEDFAHLNWVLDEVAETLSQRLGGAVGVARARASGEVATVGLDSGAEIIGMVADALEDEHGVIWLALRGESSTGGGCALSYAQTLVEGDGLSTIADGLATPIGELADGGCLSHLSASAFCRRYVRDGRVSLSYRSGVTVVGQFERALTRPEGGLLAVEIADYRVTRGEQRLAQGGVTMMVAGTKVATVFAGPADSRYWPDTEFSTKRIPHGKQRLGKERQLLGLYREALALWQTESTSGESLAREESREQLPTAFAPIATALERDFPDDWLLRWNLLECLCKQDSGSALAGRLRDQLLAIETRFAKDAPISMGLNYLAEAIGSKVLPTSDNT